MKELPSEGLHEMILFLEQNLHHFRAKVFLRIFAHMKRNEFSDIFLAQNRKYYAKSNFLSN